MVATLDVGDFSEPLAPPSSSYTSKSTSPDLATCPQEQHDLQPSLCAVEMITQPAPEPAPLTSRSRFSLARFDTPRWGRKKTSSVDVTLVSEARNNAMKFDRVPRLELSSGSIGVKSQLAEKTQDDPDMIDNEQVGRSLPGLEHPHIVVTAPTLCSHEESSPMSASTTHSHGPNSSRYEALTHTHHTDDLERANSSSSSGSSASYSSTTPMMIPHVAHHNHAHHHSLAQDRQIASLDSYATLPHTLVQPSAHPVTTPFRANKRVVYRRIHTDAEAGLMSEKEPRNGWGCRSHALGEGCELAYFVGFLIFLFLVGLAWAAHTHWMATHGRDTERDAAISGSGVNTPPPALF